jgi:hypothetical protein
MANDLQNTDNFQNQCNALPLKRPPTVNDINMAIEFIINNESLTGQMLAIDGGQHMGWCFPGQAITNTFF